MRFGGNSLVFIQFIPAFLFPIAVLGCMIVSALALNFGNSVEYIAPATPPWCESLESEAHPEGFILYHCFIISDSCYICIYHSLFTREGRKG